MNLKEIRELIQLMEEHDLTEIDLEKDTDKIRLKKSGPSRVVLREDTPMSVSQAQERENVPTTSPSKETRVHKENCETVLAPMVGTFYLQPTPDAKPYINVGDRVEKGQVLCILEAMKLMNEVKSDYSGVIENILIENAQPVEYGQPIILIRC